jgi:hypothetical protein
MSAQTLYSRYYNPWSFVTSLCGSTIFARAGQKTRNPKPEPEIPETRILFGNFGKQLVKPEFISGNSGITIGYPNYPNFHVPCTHVMLNY